MDGRVRRSYDEEWSEAVFPDNFGTDDYDSYDYGTDEYRNGSPDNEGDFYEYSGEMSGNYYAEEDYVSGIKNVT